jgi:hypothetical protein
MLTHNQVKERDSKVKQGKGEGISDILSPHSPYPTKPAKFPGGDVQVI